MFITNNKVILGRATMSQHNEWIIATVYANKDHLVCKELWHCIANHHNKDEALIMGGDFNCIRVPNDKKGGKTFKMWMTIQELVDFMIHKDLHKLDFVGPKYA